MRREGDGDEARWRCAADAMWCDDTTNALIDGKTNVRCGCTASAMMKKSVMFPCM